MELFEMSSLIAIGGAILIGLALGPILQVTWTMRLLIASYIGLCLVFLMPENFMFNEYANGIIFCVITILFALVEQGRFFDVTEWLGGRFSVQVILLSMFTWLFIFAISCLLLPYALIEVALPREVYDLFTDYVFYFAVAPLVFSVLFAKYLR